MPDDWIDVLLFGGLGLFWLLLTLWPQPLWFLWQSLLDPTGVKQPFPSVRAKRTLRAVALTTALGSLLTALISWLQP